jgi:hypothetical protein
MDFESLALTKVVHIYVRMHECIIYMIQNQFVVKMYLYQKNDAKWGIRNTKF